MRNLQIMGMALFCGFTLAAAAAPGDASQDKPRGHRSSSGANIFQVTVPEHPYDLILARPEKDQVTLSVLAYHDVEGYVSYGTTNNTTPGQTALQSFKAGTPVELVIGSLVADTAYHYQFHWRTPGATAFTVSPEYAFHTARSPGNPFAFTLTADAHLDEHTSAEVYNQTLANIRAGRPDFHIDLGNLFMTDKHATRAEAARQYLAQRYYLGEIGVSVPVLLALGVHDGESSRYDDGSPDSLADWSNHLRTCYFPNPAPDAFYSGNRTPSASAQPLQNYYAWEWGDALFVVLDPYRYSLRQRGGGDGWTWSLGQTQYQWLAQTLATSRAGFKFVFLHNLLCGDQASRGGVEIAGFNEWGGKNLDGTDGFAQHRPGWPMPVHQLLLRNHVAAVFKAHDNFYARQQLDGILYLMVPQPIFAGDDCIRDLQNYGYRQGVFRGNSGHVRVDVSPGKALVSYLKSAPDSPVADSFEILKH